MTSIHKVNTTEPRDVKRFVQFQFDLYRENAQWVPPIVSSAYKQLNRERHTFYQHSEADFFLALQGDEVVGRLAVLEPRKRNSYRNRNGAFFYLFEAVEDIEVARALFAAGFDWARGRGLDEISGPDGFLPGDSLGILVKGFEHRPAMGIVYNHSYYDEFVKDSGFAKQTDYYSCYAPGDMEMPERFCRVAEKMKERRGFKVLQFRNKAELRAMAPKVVEAYNAAFADNREFIPMTGPDAERIANRLIDMTLPHLVKVVAKDDLIVGFALGFPDVSAALQRCKGRLYPLGWAMLLLEARRTKWINFNGGGVLPEYRGLGVNAVMYYEMVKTVQEHGFDHADIVQINEQNYKMVQEMEALGVEVYKIHRLYERKL
jgi:GNAT superfamily N-acetyltransferase